MSEVAELELLMKNLQKQLSRESEELRKAVATATGTAARTKTLKSMTSPECQGSKKSHSMVVQPEQKNRKKEELDFEVPTCYGSIELREALANVHQRLKTAMTVMEKTKHQMPSQYVQKEMDDLLKNFAVLRLAFSKMEKRMEIHQNDYSDESIFSKE